MHGAQVVECEMLRMIDRPADHSDADYSHAFVPEGKKGKGKGKKDTGTPSPSPPGKKDTGDQADANGKAERFDDSAFPE